MRWECADSIRARDDIISHPKAGYMEAIFLYVTNKFYLQYGADHIDPDI
jgi:hypothetical protein